MFNFYTFRMESIENCNLCFCFIYKIERRMNSKRSWNWVVQVVAGKHICELEVQVDGLIIIYRNRSLQLLWLRMEFGNLVCHIYLLCFVAISFLLHRHSFFLGPNFMHLHVHLISIYSLFAFQFHTNKTKFFTLFF